MNICGLNFFEGEKAIRVDEQLKFIKKIFSTKPTNIFNIIEQFSKDELLEINDFFVSCGDIKLTFNKELISKLNKVKSLNKPILIRDVTYLRIIPKIRNLDVNYFPRFTWNSILPGEKNFPFDPNYNRWLDIKKKYNLHIKDYQKQGDKILFLLQIPTDASLNDLNFNQDGYIKFMIRSINNIFKFSDRDIILRSHPLNRNNDIVLNLLMNFFSKTNKVFASKNENLEDDFNNIKCVVSYNSSSTVEALFNGINVINLSKMQPCFSAASNSIADIENLKELDRETFLKKIAFLHWEYDELESNDNRKYLCELLEKSILNT